jgi:uncharacterized protein (TIGR02996 family)
VNEDEAFIRAIVDNRDETARLVYADWLDDRSDPRGAFLRAEHEAVETGDSARLPQLASALDSVWVARVSRPPFGACCDHVRFDCAGSVGSGPPLTSADLDAFERQHQLTLPVAYRAFMLNRNGGYPYPGRVAEENEEPEDWPTVEAFYMIGPIGWREDHTARIPDPIRALWDDPFGDLGRLLPLATDGGVSELYLGVNTPGAGRVFRHSDPVHAWDERPAYELAPSLGHLLARLTHTDPEWAQAIIRDDLPALSDWLGTGGDPNAEDPENEWHPLEYAVQWGRREAVRLLLARGATVTEIAWEVADRETDAEIKALVKTVCPKKPRRGRR